MFNHCTSIGKFTLITVQRFVRVGRRKHETFGYPFPPPLHHTTFTIFLPFFNFTLHDILSDQHKRFIYL